MSPKINNYSKKDKMKIRPEVSMGGGVGFINKKEKDLLNEQVVLVFQLINLTVSANQAKQDDSVTPFSDNNIVYIQHDAGIIGETPSGVSKKIINFLKIGIRFTGFISKVVKNKLNLIIEITLVSGR